MAKASTAIEMRLIGSDQTKAAFESVANRAKQVGSKISAAFKAIAITASVTAVSSKIKTSLDALNRLNDIAQQVGVSAEWLQRFTGAMGQAGINVKTEGLVASMQKLNAALVNTEKLKAFEKIGIDVSHLRGLRPEEAFTGFLEVVSKIPDEQTRLLALQRGLEEQGLRLAPLMRQGPDALKQSLAEVMAMIPVTSDQTVTLATNANNAFAMVAQGITSAWHEVLGAVLKWADESFGGVDLAIMRTFEVVKYFGKTFVRIFQTMAESVQQIVRIFQGDWIDGLKMIGARIGQLAMKIAGPLVSAIARAIGLFNKEWEIGVESWRAGIQQGLDDLEHGLAEKHGLSPIRSLSDRLAEDFAVMQTNIETFQKGLSAKPLLASALDPAAMQVMPQLQENVKKSVKEGTKQGLADGIEAGSYDALKAVFQASAQESKKRLAPTPPAAPTRTPTATEGSVSVSSMASVVTALREASATLSAAFERCTRPVSEALQRLSDRFSAFSVPEIPTPIVNVAPPSVPTPIVNVPPVEVSNVTAAISAASSTSREAMDAFHAPIDTVVSAVERIASRESGNAPIVEALRRQESLHRANADKFTAILSTLKQILTCSKTTSTALTALETF